MMAVLSFNLETFGAAEVQREEVRQQRLANLAGLWQGRFDMVRDGVKLPRLFHLRWCGFLRPVASVGRKPWGGG